MSSILTNNGAMVALQTLKSVNASLGKTQDEISTGKSVANAKDNAAVWAIAKTMETDVQLNKTIQSGLNVMGAVVGTARSGAERVTGLLQEMKNLALAASSDTSDFSKINADVTAKLTQAKDVIGSSKMSGLNLLATDVNGNGATSVDVATSVDGGSAKSLTIAGVDLEATLGATLTSITDAASAKTALGEIETMLKGTIDAAASLGTTGKRLSDQSDFVGALSDSLKSGVGSLVDADMEETSARLQALQTQQQLAIQSLSMANKAPQNILSLFRG